LKSLLPAFRCITAETCFNSNQILLSDKEVLIMGCAPGWGKVCCLWLPPCTVF